MNKYPPKDEGIDVDAHPTKDTTPRFRTDQRLRHAGFAIYSRPQHGPVIWIRHGKTHTQKDALKLARSEGKP